MIELAVWLVAAYIVVVAVAVLGIGIVAIVGAIVGRDGNEADPAIRGAIQ